MKLAIILEGPKTQIRKKMWTIYMFRDLMDLQKHMDLLDIWCYLISL